ncbi:unnamed protein product [Phyllotreta striolata]|uniref:Uncharacterized protein n=1 Tax=Phyllotreta striolata TaxID=444603 RepID=A0A9N9TDR4_PHYSR|nr:unnamed protein product [Phyllotreta striolata]
MDMENESEPPPASPAPSIIVDMEEEGASRVPSAERGGRRRKARRSIGIARRFPNEAGVQAGRVVPKTHQTIVNVKILNLKGGLIRFV